MYSAATSKKPKIVIVGGGTGGISASAQLSLEGFNDITIVEPSPNHYYQPGWTLVGGLLMDKKQTVKPTASVIPPKIEWVQNSVAQFEPESSHVVLADGTKLGYDILVVAAGIQINWGKIPGLLESLGKNGVCSNYGYDYVGYTADFVKNFKGGKAIFTQPSTPIKCAGAPQKIMYLADDYWANKDPKMDRTVDFFSGAATIFGCSHYAPALNEQCQSRNLHTHFRQEIVDIRGDEKKVTFRNLDNSEESTHHFDFLHVTPFMSPPDFIRNSPLAGETGYVDVDKHTLRSVKYPNVFGIGDSSSLPTSKTAAAISSQVPILVQNISRSVEGKELVSGYKGYTSCPIPVGGEKLILCEFNYKMEPQETFPWDQRVPGRLAYHLKKDIIPTMYWSFTLKGTFKGPDSLPWKRMASSE